ncbi:MAG: DUF817 domain-containing protein [Bacteroidota bacterium]
MSNKVFIWGKELCYFGLKQSWACLFGGTLLLLIITTAYLEPQGISRYDFLFVSALILQLLLLVLGLESRKEVQLIFVFHLVATLMEVFKTNPAIGSWYYPEDSFFHIANVPLFTGFMYSAVGSYIARAWRILRLRFSHYPPLPFTILLAAMIYINFFTHHFIWDFRWLLFALTFWAFYRTKVYFTAWKKERSMSLLIGFFLIACFIWIAENASTFSKIWVYPDQTISWQMVSLAKIGAWYLLMIISFVLVSLTKQSSLEITPFPILRWKRKYLWPSSI